MRDSTKGIPMRNSLFCKLVSKFFVSLKKNTLSRLTFSVSCLWLVFCSNAIASPFEVLHWWTEQGELESKQVLVKHLKVNDIEFEDFAIVGSGGGGAIHVTNASLIRKSTRSSSN